MDKPLKTTRHFRGLDGLRGVAALAVLLSHGSQICDPHWQPTAAPSAVDFFFLLSGFVIAGAYDRRPAMTWSDFMQARLIRLFPMLLVGTLLGACVSLAGDGRPGLHATFPVVLGSLALLPVGFFLGNGFSAYPLNSPVWSLFFGIFINGFFPTRWGRARTAKLWPYVFISGVVLVLFVFLEHGPYGYIGFHTWKTFLGGFLRVNFPFWLGVLMSRLTRERVFPSVPVSLLGLVLAADVFSPNDGKLYALVSVTLLFPVLVVLGSKSHMGHWQARVCKTLGELSYPVYLVHDPILRFIRAEMPGPVHPAVDIAVGSVLSVLVASVALVAFDRPLRRWLSRRSVPARTLPTQVRSPV